MRRVLGAALLTCCVVTPAFAADRVIQNGIDVWTTMAAGATHVDFAKTPIPAGFFCAQSEAFTGKVAFRGAPIATNAPEVLRNADTIVQRLDDAVFDKKGVATTRIQVRALSLVSMAPIETGCGKFNVSAELDGAQPTTRMRIVRENENGGRFSAPLALNTRMKFTPVGRPNGEVFELAVPVRFQTAPTVPWHTRTSPPKLAGFVLVDTDGDRSPDTYLPGTSNFVAGKASHPLSSGQPKLMVGAALNYYCHYDAEGHKHCVCYDMCPNEP